MRKQADDDSQETPMTELVDFIEAMEELMREISAYFALIDELNG